MSRRVKPGDITSPNGDIVGDTRPGHETFVRWGDVLIKSSRLNRAKRFGWKKVADHDDGRVVVRRGPLAPGMAPIVR